MEGADRTDEIATLITRLELLDRLCESSAHMRDIIDETGQARSTVHRAVNELTELGLVHRGEDGNEATLTGQLVRDQLAAYLDGFDDILTVQSVLNPLPADTDIEFDALSGGEGILSADPAPYRPSDRIHDDLTEATSYRALLPTLEESRTVRVLYEHVVTQGNPAELVVSSAVFQTLRDDFPRRMAVLGEVDQFTVLVGDVPPYGLGLLERDTGPESPVSKMAHLVVHNDNGSVHGLVVNESERGVSWATAQYEEYRDDATDRTNELIANSDGGVRVAGNDPVIGQSLPVALEREGFVQIDASYFRNEPVSSPQTAWRTGLSLTEVHTGYAIPRIAPTDRTRESTESKHLSANITAALESGLDCVLVGPPGSGKSTVCKQVACEWYDASRGHVLYRDSSRGRAFASVDDLVATATDGDGHTLVVVEDAVRPDAESVFDAMERLATEDASVSVLLDAREHEWNAYSERSTTLPDIDVWYTPSMRSSDCERLVAHFQRTTGKPIEMSTDQLWSAVDEEGESDDAPNEMLRLIHRLATYADPIGGGPTALEEAVRAQYQAVAEDETTLSVCTLVHVLNAAGVGIDRALLYAVADGDRFGAVDAALEFLEDDVLFPRSDGSYRTVHEEWSVAFLITLLDRDEARARAQFGAVATAVLALSADTDRCKHIERHLEGQHALEYVIAEPQQWTDEVVELLYSLCRRRSVLSPLFHDGAHDTIALPKTCSDAIVEERSAWLGKAFLTAGYYDRAERAFERLSGDETANRRLVGLGQVAHKRGEYEKALTYHERGLSNAHENDDLEGEVRHLNGLGLANWRLGRYERAREYFETCQKRAKELGNRVLEAKASANLGAIAWSKGEYDLAKEHFEEHLATVRDIGHRSGEATSLNNLGSVAYYRGAYDQARSDIESSLAIRRTTGYRSGQASCLNNLGLVATRQGSLKEAKQFHESALEICREIEYPREEGHSLWGLGVVERKQENYKKAEQLFEDALAVFDKTGNRSYMTRVKLERAELTFVRGNVREAREQAEDILTIGEELEDSQMLGRCRALLGQIALADGNREEAKKHWKSALLTFEGNRSYDLALETVHRLIETEDSDGVYKWYNRAQRLLDDAPEATTELHREWIPKYATEVEYS